MQAVVFDKVRSIKIKEVDTPKPGPKEVLIKVKAGGICGTDVHIYEGDFIANYPLIPGHEFSGVVEDVEEEVTDFKKGDRVAVDPSVYCHDCYFCKTNRGNHCLNWKAYGVTLNGAFADYVVVQSPSVYPIGDLSFEEAAFIEPISCVVYGLRRLKVRTGDEVLIFGSGPIGLLLMQLIKHGGASKVVVTDLKERRLKIAESLGAHATVVADASQEKKLKDMAPLGFDVVVDATGVPKVVEGMFKYIKPTGKILVFGVCPNDSRISVNPFDIYKKDLEIYGSFALCYTFDPAVRLLQNKVLDIKPLLSHTMGLNDFPKAFEMIMSGSGEAMKIQIRPE